MVGDVAVYPARNLSEVARLLAAPDSVKPFVLEEGDYALEQPAYAHDFAEVRGQEHVKRALEVAAAGGHNVIML